MQSRQLLLALLFLAFSTAPQGGVNVWTTTGANGGYARAVAFHPTPGVVLAAAGSTIYRSTDLGQTWTAAPNVFDGINAPIVIDPTNSSRIMASSVNRLWRSDDAGVTFAATSGPGGSVFNLAVGTDGSVYASHSTGKVFRSASFGAPWEDRSTGLPSGGIQDLAVDPLSPGTLYALVQSSGLHKSVDAGLQWTLVHALTGENPRKLAIDPANSAHFLLATFGNGLRESRDGGTTWATEAGGQFAWVGFHPSSVGAAVAIPFTGRVIRRAGRDLNWDDGETLNVARVYEAAFDPHDTDPASGTLLLATNEEPLLTEDAGISFAVRSQGLRGAEVRSLAVARDPDGTIYAAYGSGPAGVHKRTPSGWVPVDNAELKSRFLGGFGNPLSIAVDPNDPNTLFVASGGGLVQSFDGGAAWSTPNPSLGGVARAIAIDPFNSQVAFAATTSGLYRTTNRGATWFPLAGAPSGDFGTLALDSRTAGTLYAALSNPTIAPGLFKTANGGISWDPASTGLDTLSTFTLAVDPSDSQIVYAAGFGVGGGIFKSSNATQSWQRVASPIGNSHAMSVAVDPLVPTNIFMSATAQTGGPARSVDGGATWENLPIPRQGYFFTKILILDPSKPYNVIATDDNYGLVEFEVSPDLEATLPSGAPTVPLGASSQVTVRVTNHGPLAASAVKLTLSPPATTTAAAPAPSQGSCAPVGAAFECSLGALTVNQQVDTVLTLTGGGTPAQGTLAASVDGRESDPATGNDSLSAAIATDRFADVRVTLVSSAAAVAPQAQITLTATAANAGPNPSSDTQVVIQLSAGLTYQAASPSQGTCANSGTTVTCALGGIPASGQATVAVTATAAAAGAQTPAAQVSTTGVDPVAANNSATANVTVNAPSGGGGSGGGGAGGPLEVLALLGLGLGAMLGRRRPSCSVEAPCRVRRIR
jgi:uncharacterized repeat protein (TIGR01451 family)